MKYIYKCRNGHLTNKDFPMKDEKPATVECSVCGEEALKQFNSYAIHMNYKNSAPDNSRNNIGDLAYN